MRSVFAFFVGFISGMLFLVMMLWSHGSLRPVHAAMPVSTTVAASPAPTVKVPPVVVAAPPLPKSEPAAAAPPSDVPSLIIPIQGADASKIIDTFDQSRGGGNRHEAADIMAPRGTPILAAADGTVAKLFNSRRGGITIYQFDPTRTWCYYYAHLDHYAAGLVEGASLRQGQVIGYVGSTGDASPTAPHLHFAIFKLGPEKHWWQGTAVNPYPFLTRHAR